ncbi:MAG: hypothetical protein WDM76_10350 [Limisphaerales bacterium]
MTTPHRYVLFASDASQYDDTWTSMAELYLYDTNGNYVPRDNWQGYRL